MKEIFNVFLYLIVSFTTGNAVLGQEKENRSHNIGINLFQIPATAIDLTYEFSNNPRYTMIVNPGYTINYANSFDYIGFFLSPHYKCGNDGYTMKKQSGASLKIGARFNFKNKTDNENYFYIGALITNSLIYENAEYENRDIPNSQPENLKHQIFIFGLTGAVGYNFRISNKLYSDFGVHISMPSGNFDDLYGYSNYIPGMGYMETCGNEKVFPFIVLNLKYKLR